MAIIKKKLGINVLDAAKARIKNIFKTGCKVYLDVSGGKDSIVMSSLVYDLCKSGECDPKQLVVVFIDEEVIYDDVIRICKDWRKKFLLIGAEYHWYTIEHRNNNCFNALENNESFIPWDRYEEENWAHKKPDFAESQSPYLVPRTENYQDFLDRLQADGITMIGVRTAESYSRRNYISIINSKGGISRKNAMYPIADWEDSDVWKYIRDKNLDSPDVYLRMWEAGVPKHQLRVCNLFAIDTCKALVHMFEVYPDLWEKVLKREPNAYLVRLYWDSEMFHRNTRTRQAMEELDTGAEQKDYRAMVIDIFKHPKKYFRNDHALALVDQYRKMFIKDAPIMQEKHYKKMYEALMGGDTKGRTLRSLRAQVLGDFFNEQGVKEGWISR